MEHPQEIRGGNTATVVPIVYKDAENQSQSAACFACKQEKTVISNRLQASNSWVCFEKCQFGHAQLDCIKQRGAVMHDEPLEFSQPLTTQETDAVLKFVNVGDEVRIAGEKHSVVKKEFQVSGSHYLVQITLDTGETSTTTHSITHEELSNLIREGDYRNSNGNISVADSVWYQKDGHLWVKYATWDKG
jgi:hypothetical protein